MRTSPRFQKIKKANIMLMVLFIMFVSSLLGLIVAQYVQHLISISGLFQNYYKAYYYAYGGLELGLAQTKYHGYGFENDEVYNDYIQCKGVCQSDVTVNSRWNPLADSFQNYSSCATLASGTSSYHNNYIISSGDALILPLFFDVSTGFNAITYDDIEYTEMGDDVSDFNPMIYVDNAYSGSSDEEYLIKVIDEDLVNYNVTLTPTVSESDPYDLWAALQPGGYQSSTSNKNYLIIANATGSTKEVCIQLNTNQQMVSKYITIDSIGTYGKTVASLSAIKVDQLPSFLGYGTINSW